MKSTIASKSSVERDGAGRNTAETNGPASPALGKPAAENQVPTSGAATTNRHARAKWQVVNGSAGDHALIHQFLISIFHQPSASEFQAQLDEPRYEPSDRLLTKVDGQIAGHVRLLHREMRFGDLVVPVGIVADLATLPKYRQHGCATALLSAARKTLLRSGAVLALMATDQPQFFTRRGWIVCGRHSYSAAAPREILSFFKQRESESIAGAETMLPVQGPERYNIRLWRHVELAALMRLYEENTGESFGSLVRSDAYWRWLVGRGGNQRIYVAIDGPDKFELDESFAPIVGYAATHEGRILEIMHSAEHPEAAVQLLTRACSDAIEKDYLQVRLDAPPVHPLHPLIVQSSGKFANHEADQGLAFMTNLLNPRRFFQLMGPAMAKRVHQADLPQPCQLGLLLNQEKHQLSVGRDGVELKPGALGRSYLKCSSYEFHQLLLGHLALEPALDSGRVSVSTRVAGEIAAALFPPLPLWRPPWDEMAAE